MKKLALCCLLALLFISCKKSADKVAAQPDSLTVSGSGYWRLKEFRESYGVPVTIWIQPISDTFYVQFGANNVFKSNTSLFASRTQYQILNDSVMVLSNAGSGTTLDVKYHFTWPYLQLDGPCFEPCNYRFVR